MAGKRATMGSKAILESASPRRRNPVTAEERYRMIAQAAYYRAQQRGFVGGDPLADWLSAEVEIDRELRKAD